MQSETLSDTIEVPVWVKRGIFLLRRDSLDPNDPDHTANYIRNVLKLDPAEFGFKDERNTCPCCGQYMEPTK